jgi:1-acyl-sn-glycerol-3-phosphate acyltransferase
MNAWYWSGWTLSRILARVLFAFRIVHRERLIEQGGVLLAMNHQSFLDPPLAGIACRKAIHYLARKSLLEWPVLGPIFPKINVVPVDQDKADMSALKTVIRLLQAGERTIIFPEGGRTADGRLQPAQPGIGLVVAKTLVPVIPMRVFGAYEAFPRGAKGVRRHPITLVVGEPIQFTAEEVVGRGREVYQRIADRVMSAIAALELPPGERTRFDRAAARLGS